MSEGWVLRRQAAGPSAAPQPPRPIPPPPAASSAAAAAAASSQVAREDLSQLEIESGEGEVVRGEGGMVLRMRGKG